MQTYQPNLTLITIQTTAIQAVLFTTHILGFPEIRHSKGLKQVCPTQEFDDHWTHFIQVAVVLVTR